MTLGTSGHRARDHNETQPDAGLSAMPFGQLSACPETSHLWEDRAVDAPATRSHGTRSDSIARGNSGLRLLRSVHRAGRSGLVPADRGP